MSRDEALAWLTEAIAKVHLDLIPLSDRETIADDLLSWYGYGPYSEELVEHLFQLLFDGRFYSGGCWFCDTGRYRWARAEAAWWSIGEVQRWLQRSATHTCRSCWTSDL